jgi:hypothetical protein
VIVLVAVIECDGHYGPLYAAIPTPGNRLVQGQDVKLFAQKVHLAGKIIDRDQARVRKRLGRLDDSVVREDGELPGVQPRQERWQNGRRRVITD